MSHQVRKEEDEIYSGQSFCPGLEMTQGFPDIALACSNRGRGGSYPLRKDYMLIVHQYLRKYIRQLKGSHVAKLGGVMLSLMVLSIAGFSLTGRDASAATSAACSGQSYSVKAGDTLSGIAQQYHQSWSALAQANHLANPNVIFVGQQSCLGGSAGAAQADPPAYAPARVWQSPQIAVAPAVSRSAIEAMIMRVFGFYGSSAIRVADCESGLNPSATNPSGATGLFQIMPATFNSTSQAGRSPYDAYTNAVAAHEIFARDGYSWREWVC